MKSTEGIQVVGFDPSLRNWGYAKGVLIPGVNLSLEVSEVGVISPTIPTGKQIRQNSLDLESAMQLATHAIELSQEAQAVFVEVPIGSQSARAMASYGICVGVLGALRASSIPFFEVTPTEVKLASCGNKTATKQQMIAWATQKHPEANWPTYTRKGNQVISEAKAEHMADAIAAIYAGATGNIFQQMILFDKTIKRSLHANSI